MSTTEIICLNCQKPAYVETREINRGFGKFCGRKCFGEHHSKNVVPKEPNVKCAQCEKLFYMCESKQNASKSGLYFCCRAHKDQAQRIGGITAIMPPHYGTGTGISTYRENTLSKRPAKCERCGYDKHIAGIVIHHKDRNRENNTDDNLEVLCAICHNIEHWGEEISSQIT